MVLWRIRMDMNVLKSRIFRRTFFFLFIAIIFLICFVYIASSIILPQISKDQYRELTDLSVNRLTEHAELLVENANAISKSSKEKKELFQNERNQLQKELDIIVDTSPYFDGGTITDVYGEELVRRDIILKDYLVENDKEYVMDKILGQEIHFSNVLANRVNPKQSIILLSIPLYDENEQMQRVIHLSIHLHKQGLFQSVFKDLTIGKDSYAYIVDSNGNLIAHPKKDMIGINVSDNPAVRALLGEKSGYMELTNQFNIEMYSSYKYVPGLEWGIVTQVPAETTFLGVQKFHKSLWAITIILVILLTFLSVIHTIKTMNPIRKLHNAVDQVAKGNFQTFIKDVDSKDEIGKVLNRFNEMIQSLHSTRTQLKSKEMFLRQIIDKSPNAIYVMDREGQYLLANESFAKLLGTTPSEIIGKKESDFNPDQEDVERSFQMNREVIETKSEKFLPEIALVDTKGSQHWMQVMKIPIVEEDGTAQSLLCFATNITDRILNEEKIKFHASHDSLTQLPNRYMFKKALTKEIEMARDDQTIVAVLFMDLDRFKYVNDNFGHIMGDKLLQAVTVRLKENLEKCDTISRFGGDEFTIILPNITDKQHVSSVATNLIQELAQPYNIDGHSFVTTTSIGISLFPHDGENVDHLIKNADTAMYQAKNQGKNTYRHFHNEMNSVLSNKFRLETYMRDALKRGEFDLYYQPKMDTITGKLSGVEALLRWNQLELGMVSPTEFIPIAEESGMIVPIGEWVLEQACLQNKKWQDEGLPPIKVSVNLSVLQIKHSDILKSVQQVLEKTGLNPIWLELEITETAVMENKRSIIRTIKQLKKIGVSIAIDDFGTGYSSLNYLKRFPVDTLKIDRTFIQGILTEQNDTVITTAVISMAKN
ncbi:EAL domain-containing protein [Metabacillus litoralis]|uniref:EAL domain-containing protein n=1 Tax=Metabacillus litoralis TaxID=152268 RepID=A0A5C6VZG8_9BACI|nr:EAL domain-containing protein [Metabacillus litoralis]